ncbi:YvrJ family protein [Alkalihalobacillus sp. FSL R5-0424]
MLLSNFGFPVLVAIYLLIRFEKKIKLLISSNKKLRKYDYKYC